MRRTLALTPSPTGDTGRLLWQDNWVTFLDSMLQMSVLGARQRSLRLPTRIGAVRIDPAAHRRKVHALQGETPGSTAPRPPRPPFPVSPQPRTPTLPVSPQRCRWW